MVNVAAFVKNNLPLCICTLGLAIVGFLGYHAVRWLITKCAKTEKVDRAFQHVIQQVPLTPSPNLKSHWWTKITASPEYIEYKKNRMALTQSDKARVDQVKKLQLSYNQFSNSYSPPSTSLISNVQSKYYQPAGLVHNLPGDFGLWMPGVALVAAYLAEKKKVEGLYVCETLEALLVRLKEIIKNPSNQRCAFVVAGSGLDRYIPNFHPNFPQHKISICVEKKDGKLTIALLDSDTSDAPYRAEHMIGGIWSGNYKSCKFHYNEEIFRAIMIACRSAGCPARLLTTDVPREQIYGCAVFALQDAVAFLKDANFFDRVVCAKKTFKLDSQYAIEIITRLPPEHMIGMQSNKFIAAYKNAGGQFHAPLNGRTKTLQEYLNANLIPVPNSRNPQNHFITKKHFKYLYLALLALKYLPPAQVQSLIGRTLLR